MSDREKGIVLIGAFSGFYAVSLTYTHTLFLLPLKEHLVISIAESSLLSSMQNGIWSITIALGAWVLFYLHTKRLLLLGVMCLCGGYMWSSFAVSHVELMFSLNVLIGLGNGFLMIVCLCVLPQWFTHIGAVYGVSLAATSLGAIVNTLIVDAVVQTYGWRYGLRANFLIVFVFGSLCLGCVRSNPTLHLKTQLEKQKQETAREADKEGRAEQVPTAHTSNDKSSGHVGKEDSNDNDNSNKEYDVINHGKDGHDNIADNDDNDNKGDNNDDNDDSGHASELPECGIEQQQQRKEGHEYDATPTRPAPEPMRLTLFLSESPPAPSSAPPAPATAAASIPSSTAVAPPIIDIELFRNKAFVLYLCSVSFWVFGYYVMHVMFVPFVRHAGFDQSTATAALVVVQMSVFAGKVVGGVCSDKYGPEPVAKNVFTYNILSYGLWALLSLFLPADVWWYYVVGILVGASNGAVLTSLTAACGEIQHSIPTEAVSGPPSPMRSPMDSASSPRNSSSGSPTRARTTLHLLAQLEGQRVKVKMAARRRKQANNGALQQLVDKKAIGDDHETRSFEETIAIAPGDGDDDDDDDGDGDGDGDDDREVVRVFISDTDSDEDVQIYPRVDTDTEAHSAPNNDTHVHIYKEDSAQKQKEKKKVRKGVMRRSDPNNDVVYGNDNDNDNENDNVNDNDNDHDHDHDRDNDISVDSVDDFNLDNKGYQNDKHTVTEKQASTIEGKWKESNNENENEPAAEPLVATNSAIGAMFGISFFVPGTFSPMLMGFTVDFSGSYFIGLLGQVGFLVLSCSFFHFACMRARKQYRYYAKEKHRHRQGHGDEDKSRRTFAYGRRKGYKMEADG